LRLVAEAPAGGQETITLTEADVNGPLAAMYAAHGRMTGQPDARIFLKCGRFIVEVK
jgi:hypothetical protein